MSSDINRKCSECGGLIPAGSAHCPACMLGRAIGGNDSLGDLSDNTTSSLDGAPVTEGVGDSIGAYKLLEKIGEGGFGVVYMAKQEKPVRRQVALKIIKLGMDTKQVVGRFEAERQALAMMEHPSIAKVLDAGSTDAGRPYFVMELVHGVPITEFCSENRLTTEERLKLFVKVCNAVQHAHQKGIIHRDLKPSNILVTMHDDEAVPKVIDFGIAKATQHDLTDKTLFTQFRHFLGTPAYMSPEQAQMSGLGVDTRSDIYSLGVLLYELLTGCTPLDLKPAMESGYDEVRRTIREEEPMKPSAFVSQLSGAKQTTLSKQSRMSSGALHSQLRGDLDWIAMKAIEKDRTRRYETANAFAKDVELFLRDEPVSAVAPSAWYLLTKLMRRHKPVFVALGLVLPLLILAAGVSGCLYWEEREANRNLRLERSEKDLINRDLKQANQGLREMMERDRLVRYASDLDAAHKLVASWDITKAQRLLDRYLPMDDDREDLREFTWYYLRELIHEKQGDQIIEADVALRPGRFSPDGNWLLTLSDGRGPMVWDIRRRRMVAELDVAAEFEAADGWFSTSGRFLMIRESPEGTPAAGESLEVMLWRISGKRFEPLPSVHCLAWPSEKRSNVGSAARFIPGTSLLALAGEKGVGPGAENDVILYDVESSEIVKTLSNAGTIADVSPDGKTLVTQRWKQDPPETVFWDASNGAERHRTTQLTYHFLNFFAADQILVTKDSGRMELRDVHTLERLELPLFPLPRVDRLQMSDDGRRFILSRYPEREYVYWDSASGHSVALGSTDVVSPDGQIIAKRLRGGGIALINTDSLSEPNQIDGARRWLPIPEKNEVLLHFDDARGTRAFHLPWFETSRFVSSDEVVGLEEEGVLWTRSVEGSEYSGRIIRKGSVFSRNEIELDPRQIVKVKLLSSGKLLLRYNKPGRLELRDRETLEVLVERDFSDERFKPANGGVVPEFNVIVPTFGLSRSIVLISTETLETIETRAVSDDFRWIRYLESERRLLVFFDSGIVQEYSMPEIDLLSEYHIGSSVYGADISPDGATIAVMRRSWGEGAFELLSRRSKLPLISVDLEGDVPLRSLRFSRSGEVLLTPLRDDYSKRAIRWYPAPR